MLFANNANTTLASSLTNSATTMSVVSASAFPSPTGSQYFYCTLADAATQTTIEIVKVTAVSGTTFTIVRGQDGTTGTIFASGAVVSLRLVAASLNDFPKLDEANTFTGTITFSTPLLATNMVQSTTSTSGYLSNTDWNTFNGKSNTNGTVTSVAALTLGTTGTDLSSTVANGTTTPVITLQVPTASATNRGALSSADWSTFNGKAPGVTFTTGYVPFGQGTTTLNQSANLTWSGTNLKAIGSITSSVANSATKQLSLSATNGANADCNIWLSTNYTLIAPSTATPLAFGTATTEQMRLFASGGVSIGNTTDPGATNLSVSGKVIIGDAIGLGSTPSYGTSGQVLTSSGSSAAPTWTTVSGGSGGLSWQSVQTANFTASAGNAYPVNTTSGAITVTLPASPTANQLITIVDYAGTAATNNILIAPNGNKIQGNTGTFALIINRQAVNLIYVDSTQGWVSYADQGVALTPPPITISYLIVAGGGGGGSRYAGGGGAGGLLSGTTGLIVGTTYSFAVGSGGAGNTNGGDNLSGTSGNNSTAFSLTAIGGGYGNGATSSSGGSGGSGGGGNSAGLFGGSGTSGQGNDGATALLINYTGAGGGGASSAGSQNSSSGGGNGGAGTASSITGSSVNYAGGGGGGTYIGGGVGGTGGTGGAGGGGNGAGSTAGSAGTANTGGGGGGGGGSSGGSGGYNGGSGVVILSVPTASYSGTTTGSPTVTTSGSNTIVKFTSSGSYTA